MQRIERKGEISTTKEGYLVEIIEYLHANNMTIRFLCNGYIMKNVLYRTFKKGTIKNPYHPSVCGKGYIGVGKYIRTKNRKNTKPYQLWMSILHRCYDEKFHKKQPTYKDVTVCEEWHNFQNFAKWFEENYVEGWHLDKDILSGEEKIYSPETCCFLPQKLNNLFLKSDKYSEKHLLGVVKDGNGFMVQLAGRCVGRFKDEETAHNVYKAERIIYGNTLIEEFKSKLRDKIYKQLKFKNENYFTK